MVSVAETVTIRTKEGDEILIDAADYHLVGGYKWRTFRGFNGNKQPYARALIGPDWILMHRFLLNAPKGSEVDHWNGNGLDNRRKNLRFATATQNRRNQRKTRGSSQFKGVTSYRNGRWRASIKANGKHLHLGYFKTEKSAALAYNEAAQQHFGDFARINSFGGEA